MDKISAKNIFLKKIDYICLGEIEPRDARVGEQRYARVGEPRDARGRGDARVGDAKHEEAKVGEPRDARGRGDARVEDSRVTRNVD